MFKVGLGFQALLAVILGILVGLFFGPMCKNLEPIGTAFVMLLQMVVLPYIPTLLMHGLGSLSPDMAKKLFTRGWFYLLMLWAIIIGVIFIVSVLIPPALPAPAADYYEKRVSHTKNFLTYIIPQNPFYDLSHNIIPAVAIFSVIVGVAIMHLKNKEPLLSLLEKTNLSLERIFKWISLISPIGIFAHIASAMGTVNLEDLGKIELYVIVFVLTSLFLSIWVLPTIVSCLTGLEYKELIREYRIVCMLAFATGIPSIAFPFINNCMRRLSEKKNLDLATFRSTSQTVVPLAYSFAQIGNFFFLFFIFFMSFYYRHPLSEKETLLSTFFTVPISFGTPQLSIAGMSFLIDALNLPRQAFTLFVETAAITLNFQVLLSVSGMLSFIMLVLLRYYGLLNVNWRRLSFQVTTMVVVLLGSVVFAKQFINIEDNYRDLYYKLQMSSAVSNPPKVTILRERVPKAPDPNPEALSRILSKGILRVGYDVTNIPYCYLNKWGELVGYDVAFAYQLAKDLDVALEFVPLNYDLLGSDLDSGYYDIGMSAIVIDEERILAMDFCNAYSEQANALVVPVQNLDRFRDLSEVYKDNKLKIGAAGAYRLVVKKHFPLAQMVETVGFKEIFDKEIDAMMWAERPAYIWCLGHPEFTSLLYNNQLGLKFFAYPVKTSSNDTISFINHWLALKEQNGFTLRQSDYWVRGKPLPGQEPRWSIIRDVLHWVK